MKHSPNRRSRRPNGRRGPQNIRSQNFESNGPEGRIRGTAQQVLEKYLVLGRDSASAGEHIQAEAFYQHAEHYFRLLNADPGYQNRQGEQRRPTPADGDPASFSQDSDGPGGGGGGEPAGMGEQPGMPEQTGAGEQQPQKDAQKDAQTGAQTAGAQTAGAQTGSQAGSQTGSKAGPETGADAGRGGGGETGAGREIPITQESAGDAEKPAAAAPKRRGRPPKSAAGAPAE